LSPGGREATALLRIGRADPRFNEFRDTVHLSVAWSGGLSGREGERVGLGVARAWRGEDARAAAAAAGESLLAHETVVELTWKLPVTPRLSLQPDVQYIMQPGGVPGRRDALAIGLRFDLQVTQP
jgi:porin